MVPIPSTAITGRAPCSRTLEIFSASIAAPRLTKTSDPGRKRCSGKSVSRFTITWPRRPWARAIRPTSAISSQIIDRPSLPALANFECDVLALALAGARRQRAQRGGRATLPPDQLPEIRRRHEQLDERLVFVLRLGDAHVVRPIRQRARQHFDD